MQFDFDNANYEVPMLYNHSDKYLQVLKQLEKSDYAEFLLHGETNPRSERKMTFEIFMRFRF